MVIAPRRFWTQVSVAPEAEGFGLRLDTRALRTPAHAPLLVPTWALAEAIASEWRAVQGEIRPEALPFTRAANVAVDRVAPDPGPVVDALAAYGETDLLCYRASEPEVLRRRQAQAWDPMLGWAAAALDAPLETGEGVVHVTQPAASLKALRAAVTMLDPFALTALHELVTSSGSLVLGLAVVRGALAVEDAWDRSRIDEDWQISQWGEDAEAAAATDARREEFLRAGRLLEMLAVTDASAHKA